MTEKVPSEKMDNFDNEESEVAKPDESEANDSEMMLTMDITPTEMKAYKEIGKIEKTVHEETDVEWKFDNIQSATAVTCYESPHFMIENAKWFFKICPKWARESDFMRLYLMGKEQRDYTVEYKLSSKLPNDNVEVLATGLLREKHMCSDPVFIKSSTILKQKSEQASTNTVTIKCTLMREVTPSHQLEESEQQKKKETATAEINKIEINKWKAAEFNEFEFEDTNSNTADANEKKESAEDALFDADINWLLKEKKNIDVTFIVETPGGEKEIFAHQLILSVWSSYFSEEFYDEKGKKGQKIIPLTGVNSQAFEKMIRYCYGYDPGLQTTEEAYSLFKVASEFKVISLVHLCHTFLRHTTIHPGNVFTVLKISEEIEDKSLKESCKKVLEEKTKEVISSYELCDITPAMMHNILNLLKLSLNSEYDLISWIFKWARVKSKDKYSIYENARNCLEKLLQSMNFLFLTTKEFAMLCMDNPDVLRDDEIASISLNIALSGARKMPNWYDKDLKVRVYTG